MISNLLEASENDALYDSSELSAQEILLSAISILQLVQTVCPDNYATG